MINLGDYIGQVLRELTIARVKADLEAARVAELYSEHELLKHFPIPRIRLSEFDAELRFLILAAEDDPEDKTVVKEAGVNFKKFAIEAIRKKGITLSESAMTRMGKLVDASVVEIEASTTRKFDLPSIATHMAPMLEKVLEDSDLDKDAIREVRDEVDKLTRDSILGELSRKPRLRIAVTSNELKEADPGSIITISLKAKEEGIEWTQITSDSEDGQNSTWKLVPE